MSDKPESIGGWPLTIGGGEAKATVREEHLCNRCLHQGLCRVDTAIVPEMLVVISRCGSFIEPSD